MGGILKKIYKNNLDNFIKIIFCHGTNHLHPPNC